MNTHDTDPVRRTLSGLDAVTDHTPGTQRQRLDAARRAALNAPVRRHPAWLPAGALAAVLAAVLITAGLHESPLEPDEMPVADAELYEDMEFYLWLAEELESSPPSRS